MGKELDNMVNLLTQQSKKAVPLQNTWVTCKSVDWSKKTMVCTSLTDGLDYYDVLLGIGAEYRKPKQKTKCLIGSIANKEAASFLIYAEEIEEYLIEDSTGFKFNLKDGKLTINGDQFSGIVKAPELKTQVDKNTEILKQIQTVFNSWSPISQDGGAALKALVTAFTSLPLADLSNIENENIKHG